MASSGAWSDEEVCVLTVYLTGVMAKSKTSFRVLCVIDQCMKKLLWPWERRGINAGGSSVEQKSRI